MSAFLWRVQEWKEKRMEEKCKLTNSLWMEGMFTVEKFQADLINCNAKMGT